MANIVIQNATKRYGENTVIQNLNLTLEDGLFTVLVGPSGCGKTTLLRMIAGIESVTEGTIFIDGEDVTKTAASKRGVAMVFQNYAIYPTMTVRENIEFGLKNAKIPKPERELRITEVCDAIGLTEYLERKPSQLSGGQRQRVALARAMVKKPRIFLMDEPLSNLDAKLRAQMRIELKELHRRLGTTFVYVTHDQIEAMSMADNIVLMEQGIIRQEASPETLYADPQHVFAAKFIGTPPMNILAPTADGVQFGCRPENIQLSNTKTDAFLSIPCTIITHEMLGSETHFSIQNTLGKFMVKLSTADASTLSTGNLYCNISAEDLFLFDKNGQRIAMADAVYAQSLESLKECADGTK